MVPITVVTALLEAAIYLVVLFVIGGPLAFLITRLRGLSLFREDRLAFGALALGSGMATIPLLFVLLDTSGIPFNAPAVWGILLVFLAIDAMVLIRFRERLLGFLRATRRSLSHPRSRLFLLAALAVPTSILLLHILLPVGLFVHPGDDAKLYSLISVRILEEGGIAEDWGLYAPSSWFQERTHLLIPGYASLVAFFYLLTGIPLSHHVTVGIVTLTALISFGVYLLARGLGLGRGASLASAFVFGVLILEPNITWFSWGGHAEISSLVLLPIVVGLTVRVSEQEAWAMGSILAVGALTAGMLLLHPFSGFYLMAFLVPFAIWVFFRKKKAGGALFPFAPLAVGLALLTPVLIRALPAEAAISSAYSVDNPAWTPIFFPGMNSVAALGSIVWRMSVVFGVGLLILLIAAPWLLRGSKWDWKLFLPLGLWIFALFLLHENNPNGLFIVQFPLWYRIDSNRTFNITSLPLSVILGPVLLAAVTSLGTLLRRVRLWSDKGPHPRSPFRPASVVATLILVAVLFVQFTQMSDVIGDARQKDAVSAADAEAILWISENLPGGIFFVSEADAGPWITPLARQRTVIPFGVVTNSTFFLEYQRIQAQMRTNPESVAVLDFLNREGVDYVYVGARKIYRRPGLNPMLLEQSALYEMVYNRSGVWIFSYG